MGSPCEIQHFATSAAAGRDLSASLVAEVERLEAMYSRYRPESFLSEMNRVAATGGCIRVDTETTALLNYADACYAQSGGLFDITSGILRRAWHFDRGEIPEQAQVNALLDRVGWRKLRWSAPLLEFTVPGMELDFGGIVKEYAADRLSALCLDAGAHQAVVNLGGDIRVIGPRADESPWRIGIRDPRHKDAVITTVTMHRGALASSGDYERCIVIGGVRYGHILDPRTGWPVRHLAAVSVIADLCVVAGSASTIAMLRAEQGPAWLKRLGLPYLWVDMEGRIGGNLVPGSSRADDARPDMK
jgi:FAD:protein FMN transferase